MQKSKLFDYLISLTRKEFLDLGKYLQAQNPNKNVIKLYEYIKKYHPNLDHKKLSKELAYQSIFKSKNYDRKKILVPMSELYQELEQYVIKLQLEKEEGLQNLLHRKYLGDRKVDKHFFNQARKHLKTLEESTNKDNDYFYQQYLINKQIYAHPNTRKWAKDIDSFNNLTNHLDLFYIGNKLKYACENINRSSIIAEEQKEPFVLEEILNQLAQDLPAENPLIPIYYYFIVAFKNGDFTYYHPLKELILENRDSFTFQEQYNFLILLINYCQTLCSSDSSYIEELFQLYQYGIETRIFFTEKPFSDGLFNHTIHTACVLKKYDWVENFIKEYSNLLPEIRKDAALNYNQALLAYHRKQYKEALLRLQEVTFPNVTYKILAKCMTLFCYYELGNDAALSLYDFAKNFRSFLRREKNIAEPIKKANLNFISFVNLLTEERHKSKKNRVINKLTQKLEATPRIAYKRWLSDKIQELS